MKTDTHDSESEIKAQIKAELVAAHWQILDLADKRPMRRHQRNWPDLVCLRHDHCLMIQVKAKGGRPRPGQIEFGCKIAPHLGQHLVYIVARGLDDLPAFAFRLDCNA